MRCSRRQLCEWMAWAGEPFELKWSVIERHLDPAQYQWFISQPLHRVQLVLDTDYRADDQRWIRLMAEFFDPDAEQQYCELWAK